MNIPNLLTSEVLKSVIAARKSMAASPENAPEKPKPKPMTVFYGGSVAVFEVTPEKVGELHSLFFLLDRFLLLGNFKGSHA